MKRAGTEYFAIHTVINALRSTRGSSDNPGSNPTTGTGRRSGASAAKSCPTVRIRSLMRRALSAVSQPRIFSPTLIEGIDNRHRRQPISAEPAHLALHTALLVRPGDTRLAVERIKLEMRMEQHPPRVLHPGSGLPVNHFLHRTGQVVVADVTGRDTADLVECRDMTFKERFLPLRRVHPVHSFPRMREAEGEHVAFGFHPGQYHPHFTEIDFRLGSGSVFLRDEHFDAASGFDVDLCSPDPHVITHR